MNSKHYLRLETHFVRRFGGKDGLSKGRATVGDETVVMRMGGNEQLCAFDVGPVDFIVMPLTPSSYEMIHLKRLDSESGFIFSMAKPFLYR